MKNYDEKLEELWENSKEFFDNLLWTVLNFIFETKVGHIIFNMVFVMLIMGLISLLFSPERRPAILTGAFVGGLATAIYFAWKDNNENWI